MAWTAPRTFVTAEIETAAIFNTHLRDNLLALNGFVRKTVDEPLTSNASLQNDNELLYTIGATGTYVIDMCLIGTSAANAAGDLLTSFTFPTGTFYFFGDGLDAALASGSVGTVNRGESTVASGVAMGVFGLSTTATFINIRGLYIATATGTLQFQWAQAASNVNASTIKAGSFMTVCQVA